MNLTGRPVYHRCPRSSNQPTLVQRKRWERIRSIGCIICQHPASIHHTHTGRGGRKDHDKVIGLCWTHHQGPDGIHTLGRRIWQEKYGSEDDFLKKVDSMLEKRSALTE